MRRIDNIKLRFLLLGKEFPRRFEFRLARNIGTLYMGLYFIGVHLYWKQFDVVKEMRLAKERQAKVGHPCLVCHKPIPNAPGTKFHKHCRQRGRKLEREGLLMAQSLINQYQASRLP